MSVPPKPTKPPPPESQSNTALTTIFTLLLLAGFSVGLVLLSLGSILGPLLLLFLVLPAVAMFHYLVWGWWLGKMINDSADESEDKSWRSDAGK